VDLVRVIQSAMNTVRSGAIAKSIHVECVVETMILEGDRNSMAENYCSDSAMYVSGDAVRLQQVVWNLLSNAVKFTPEQGHVHIQLERMGDQAQITVKDSGKGIRPEVLPYLFQPFFQEEEMTQDRARKGGLGLGLMIVRQLVEAHGGTISADSAGHGCGAVFTVTLPLLADSPERDESDEMVPFTPDLSGIRVLVVDEDADNRELTTIWLNQQGANVLAVSSTALVMPVLRTFRPHVYVGEIGFSDANGFCFMQQLRALPQEQGGQIPAIALTAYAGENYRKQAFVSGYQRYLVKPCESEQLIQAVSELSHEAESLN
jgi:CheY-like chemotaxis protein